MAVVTFDLWHTLIQLSPEAEDRYVKSQVATLADILENSPSMVPLGSGQVLPAQEAAQLSLLAAADRKTKGAPLGDMALDAARRAGREADPTRWVQAIEALVAKQPFEAVPGARDQLKRVRNEGFRTAIVSNIVGETGRIMRTVLEELDMARYIESWAFSEELPWAKPAPEIFWKALEPLDTQPSDAVHIGDRPTDIHGARAAGFRDSILFVGARAYGPLYASIANASDIIDPPPDHVLSHWEELPPLLNTIFDLGDTRARSRPAVRD